MLTPCAVSTTMSFHWGGGKKKKKKKQSRWQIKLKMHSHVQIRADGGNDSKHKIELFSFLVRTCFAADFDFAEPFAHDVASG